MNMTVTVSIIVPVYNAEKYLCRCVDSILHQDYQALELLLLDDGSTDGSATLCDDYAARDSRVRVIHKPNSGVSDTRNLGIAQARGEYLQFIDSDDWITPDCTRLLVRTAQQNCCDMVVADFYRVIGERLSHKGGIGDRDVLSREAYVAHMMESPANFYYGVLWNKLYRRDIIQHNGLRMNPDIRLCEDFMFNLEYIRCAGSFCALQVPVYYYVKTRSSLSAASVKRTPQIIRMKLMAFECYQNFFKSMLDDKDYEQVRLKVYRFLIDAATDGLVAPLPGTQRLGDERSRACAGLLQTEGFWQDAYRDRKLMERMLESVALRHSLTLRDVKFIMHFELAGQPVMARDVQDAAGMNLLEMETTLAKLIARKMVRVQRGKDSDWLDVTFLPEADGIRADIRQAMADAQSFRLADLTEEEVEQYTMLQQKIAHNIIRVLGEA
ncbi:MAG: glycosyltransferase family 2 protein [Aristaeellaceae bacterium]